MPMYQEIAINNTRKYTLNTKECKISVIKEKLSKRKNFILQVEEINENIFNIICEILRQKDFNKISLYLHYTNFVNTDPQLLRICIKKLYKIVGVEILFIFDRSLVSTFVPFYEFRCF